VDEMSLKHLCTIPAFAEKIVWATDHPVGQSLKFFPVSPIYGQAIFSAPPGVIVQQTPVGYFSNLFNYWRGSFVLTIKLVKTQFHSGRIQVTYNPSGSQMSINDSLYLFREIIDIRDANEFKFKIPFVSNVQYLERGANDGIGCADIGIVQIRVVNRLVRPDSVADHVDILLEWSADEDFEVMGPRSHTMLPVIQMDTSQTPVGTVAKVAKDIGTSSVDSSSIEPAAYCVGEKIASILQLGKRFSRTTNGIAETGTATKSTYAPFTISKIEQTGSLPMTQPLIGYDTYSMLANCFAYSTGSMRLLKVRDKADATSMDVAMSIDFNSGDYYSVNTVGTNFKEIGVAINFPSFSVDAPLRGMNIPAYQKTPFRLNVYESQGNVATKNQSSSDVIANFSYSTTTTVVPGSLYRAMGDDAALGFFIGCPRVAVTTGNY